MAYWAWALMEFEHMSALYNLGAIVDVGQAEAVVEVANSANQDYSIVVEAGKHYNMEGLGLTHYRVVGPQAAKASQKFLLCPHSCILLVAQVTVDNCLWYDFLDKCGRLLCYSMDTLVQHVSAYTLDRKR